MYGPTQFPPTTHINVIFVGFIDRIESDNQSPLPTDPPHYE